MEELSPQLKQKFAQFQQMQQQAQAIATQRAQMELQLKDVERTLKSVEGLAGNAELYRSAGSILIRSTKDEVTKELADRKETLDLRIKTLLRQEERFQEKLKQMQEDLQKALGASGAAAG